jgi:hypothetical protein
VVPNYNWREALPYIEEPIIKLVQHHMAHPTWTVYDVHNYHRSKYVIREDGTKDYWAGIGYNYWIGFDGTIYEGRGRKRGAHAGAEWSGRSLGIGYQGHFNQQEMTDAQLRSGAWLNAILIVEDNLSVDDIIGHGDILSTSCPGKNFRMQELREETQKLLPAGF